MELESSDLIHWLLRNAGPIIKYRTLVDIVDEQDVGIVGHAMKDLWDSPIVNTWLDRLQPVFEFNAIHSGRITAYENVMGKLVQLGARAGLQPFDNRTLAFRTWLSDYSENPTEIPFTVFLTALVASFLSYAGYGTTTPVRDVLISRLKSIYGFSRVSDFDSIYVEKSQYKGISKNYDAHDLVDPALNRNQEFELPWVHDIRGFSFCNEIMNNKSLRAKAENIVEMILRKEYQQLPWGYGITKYAKKYYAIGWSVHLPGYNKPAEVREFGEMLLTLEMLAKFDCVRKSKWFKETLGIFEQYRTEIGTYQFPRAWLPEKRNRGYWVGGEYMSFDERKGKKNAIECESTFWALRIQKLADLV